MKTDLDSRFQSVFHDPTGLYFKAMLLDPRFKRRSKSLFSSADFSMLKESVIVEFEHEMIESQPAASSTITDPTMNESAQSVLGCNVNWPRRATIQSYRVTFQMTANAAIECYLSESCSVSLISDPIAITGQNRQVKILH